MTKSEEINRERLLKSIEKCQLHLARIHYAQSQVKNLFPLNREKYIEVTDANIGNIDQLVFRFTKLQDEIGTNTFRFLLEYLKEDVRDKPFRDILNRLEQLRIVDAADTWITLRELRNDLAHEYPMMIDETIEKLNFFLEQLHLLEKIFLRIVEVSET